MSYSARSHVAPGDLGTAADNNQGMDNEAALWPFTAAGQIAVASSTVALVAKTPGWNPDVPPASPGAADDEFGDSSLAGAWSEYDPDAKTTWVEGNGGLAATILTTATADLNGLYKAIPAGDFTVYAKVSLSASYAASTVIGIALWEDPTGDNDAFIWGLCFNATAFTCNIYGYTFTNRTTPAVAKYAATAVGHQQSMYLRLRRTGTNYSLDYSLDGAGWIVAAPGVTFVFTPTKFGIGVTNSNTGVTQYAYCQFFRYIASDVGASGILAGDRL